MYGVLSEGGLRGFTRHRSQKRQAAVSSAAALWADLMAGRAPSYFLQEALAPRTPAVARAIEGSYPGLFQFQEAMTRSDFPLLTGDVIDRMMLARYREFPSPWRSFCKVSNTLRDFRTVRRIAMDGAESVWQTQGETEELEYTQVSETGYTYAPQKYSRGARISFEALMNDDLDAFTSIPDRLGRGGARTVARFATGLYVDASGPHASLYTAGNGNRVTSNPPLSVAGLGTAFNLLGGFVDAGGDPIYVEEAILVIPPQLRVTANNILNQLSVDVTASGGTAAQTVRVNNWIVGNLELVVDPYIPIVASTANGQQSWFLFADPSVGRPALEVGFLSGFNEPQLYQKAGNTMRLGGGMDEMAGDFSTMSQEYKGVVAFGGTRLDPKGTVGSNGTNS
jgi:hypothetical protein